MSHSKDIQNEKSFQDKERKIVALQQKKNSELLSDLENILDTSTAENLDVSLVQDYLELLDKRAPIPEEVATKDVWSDFKNSHSVLFEEHSDTQNFDEGGRESPHKNSCRIFIRVGIVAAILATFCISAAALGFRPVKAVIEWASEALLVYWHPSGNMELHSDIDVEYHSLEEALKANGVDAQGCIQWIPEEYSLANIDVLSTELGTKYIATYSSGKSELFVRVMQMADKVVSTYEKEKGGKTVVHDDIEFFVLPNNGITTISWKSEQCIFTITGELSEKEVELIIKSV